MAAEQSQDFILGGWWRESMSALHFVVAKGIVGRTCGDLKLVRCGVGGVGVVDADT